MYAASSHFYASEASVNIELRESTWCSENAGENGPAAADLNGTNNSSKQVQNVASPYPKQEYTESLADNLTETRTSISQEAYPMDCAV